MLELNYALEHIMKGIDETVTEYGFRPEYPNGVFPPQLPIEKDGEKSIVMGISNTCGRIAFALYSSINSSKYSLSWAAC